MDAAEGWQRECPGLAQAYVKSLADKAKQRRLPELFCEKHPKSLFQHIGRRGVSAIAIAQRDLPDCVLEDVLLFRLANALLYGHVAPEPIYNHRAAYEWWFSGGPDDILVLSGSSETGQIGGHLALAFLPDARPGMTLRWPDRPLFESERLHGPRAFSDVPCLSDLQVTRLAEARAFVKSYWLDPLDELAFRATAELGVAAFHAFAGPLAGRLDAVVGSVTEAARRTLEFFTMRFVSPPSEAPAGEKRRPEKPLRRAGPMAILTRELPFSAARVAAVEAALELPGRLCLQALAHAGPPTPEWAGTVA